MYGEVVTAVERPSTALLESFGSMWSTTVSDTLGRFGAMDQTVRPAWTDAALVGSALTVLCYPGDNLAVHKALDLIRPGDVLVIDSGGAPNTAVLGHNICLRCKYLGAVGVVTNGPIRDIRQIREEGYPVFSGGIVPRSPQKGTMGAVNVPISVGGVTVSPGDIVIADEDGVVVVPLAIAAEIAATAEDRMQMEHQQAIDIRDGKKPLEILFGEDWVAERVSRPGEE
jgi:4-hydroxy-4-methyl-2-oxoglutarate aldolase